MITRTPAQIRTISDFLASSDRLSRICDHIGKINELQVILYKYLEYPLNNHVTVADYQKKTLVLHTDSAAWAAKLRYRTPAVLKVFKNDLPGIRTIRIKVVPSAPLNQASHQAEQITPETACAIRQMADKIEDTALRSALYSIAENALTATPSSQSHGSKRPDI